MDKRHFTVVIGSKEHGLYISSKPSSAAKKAVSKLCAANKSKKVEFCLREITQGSKKKTYGPYLGEMKKLKTPIELKGRVIRYEIKVHLKKGKSSTIKTSKKMNGGGPFVFNKNLNKYRKFVHLTFQNHIVKDQILKKILNHYTKLQNRLVSKSNSHDYDHYIFYIYNKTNNQIISTGIIGKNNFTLSRRTGIDPKEYLHLEYLLSSERGNRGGTSAIYHILSRLLQTKYRGICLRPLCSVISFYEELGFTDHEGLFTLDKTQENIDILESKLPHPITTEFYSTYPDNIIT
jgi:hypothetical protein